MELLSYAVYLLTIARSLEYTTTGAGGRFDSNVPRDEPQNCADLYLAGDIKSGQRIIHPIPDQRVTVFCDQETDGGGWTVFQHRENLPVRENFFRNWIEYELGFGDINGEFWLGLDNIHTLVNQQLMEIRFDLEDFDNISRFAKYSYFYITDGADNYTMDLGTYSGNAGDSFGYHNKQPFSAKDRGINTCAEFFKGAWWYNDCHQSNLNGYQYQGDHDSLGDGINWGTFKGFHYSLKRTTMMIRPQAFP